MNKNLQKRVEKALDHPDSLSIENWACLVEDLAEEIDDIEQEQNETDFIRELN